KVGCVWSISLGAPTICIERAVDDLCILSPVVRPARAGDGMLHVDMHRIKGVKGDEEGGYRALFSAPYLACRASMSSPARPAWGHGKTGYGRPKTRLVELSLRCI